MYFYHSMKRQLVDALYVVGPSSRLELVNKSDVREWFEAAYQPCVLDSFTPHGVSPSPTAIAAFCAPRGLRIRKGQQATASPRFACFVLTQGDGTRIYGHCLTVHEPLPPSTEVPHLQGARATAPLLADFLQPGESCVAPRSLCLLSSGHFPLAFKASLLALHTLALASRDSPVAMPIETCLTHLVLNVPRPVPGGPMVRFALGNGVAALHVDSAPLTQLPSMDYSLCELLGRLEPRGLLQLFHVTLLEQQIIIVCDDDELRVAACELTLALLHPLEWAHVYVPTIPDELIDLLSNPFPCILGLRAEQAAHLPRPLPASMAIVHLDGAAQIVMPSAELPPLPPREARHLLASLLAAAHAPPEDCDTPGGRAAADKAATPALEQLLFADSADAAGEADLAGVARTPAMLEARTRGAFLRFLVSVLRDLHRFVPEAEAPPAVAGGEDGRTDAQAPTDILELAEGFVLSQPAGSQAFLQDFVRTQLFLSFVQPLPAESGGKAGDNLGRGGRCFQLVRDAFLQRELSHAAERERQHSRAPLPVRTELLNLGAQKLTSLARANETVSAAAFAVFDVAPPVMASVPAEPRGRYLDGLPTKLPTELHALQTPLPLFEGALPPAPRVSASVREAWAEALGELERRNDTRAGAQLAAGVGSSIIIGGAAATLMCTLQ